MKRSKQSIHNEWISLLDISGPFLSPIVLEQRFTGGLSKKKELRADLLAAYEEWAEHTHVLDPNSAYHTAWVRYVLEDILAYRYEADLFLRELDDASPYTVRLPERNAVLSATYALQPDPHQAPWLLIKQLPATQGIDKRSKEAYDDGEMTPVDQMVVLLRENRLLMGLVTNGEDWMLIYVPPSEAITYVGWRADMWLEEPITFDAFYHLLHLGRFHEDAEATFPAMMEASKDHQKEVTDTLGAQVRQAVEILVQDIANQNQLVQQALYGELTETVLYEAALTVMMRLIFLLSAEEQGLLLLGNPIYDNYYAVSTLRLQLSSQTEQAILDRQTDAWPRLLATFRAVHTGVWHHDLPLPAYGGSLFDPDRFPFLEGRKEAAQSVHDSGVTSLLINNRTVLHLLEALQLLRLAGSGKMEPTTVTLSFRGLGVEQIGHVYEGLLDHKAVKAKEIVLGLAGAKGLEPEIPLSELLVQKKKGEQPLLDYLSERTGRAPKTLTTLMAQESDKRWHNQIAQQCRGNEALIRQVMPFANLLREDSREHPVIIHPGQYYVTDGTDRRASGSHYTPRSLTEPIVQHTLEPLVYNGVAEGLPKERWHLKRASELLRLKICDMAMGSGAFLVQACRYLADRLMEAWQAEEGEQGQQATPTRPFTGRYTDQNLDELYTLAKRLVAERCLYGVDKNPLAVEMAKMSLWLITLSGDKPFTFVDHALRHGDSLIGVGEAEFTYWANSNQGTTWSLFDEQNRQELAKAKTTRRELQQFQVLDNVDAARKIALLQTAHAQMARITTAADFLVGLELLDWKTDARLWQTDAKGKTATGNKAKEIVWGNGLLTFQAGDPFSSVAQRAIEAAQKQAAFHWQFQFPEVFEQGGFSGFIGNPPFIGGSKIRGAMGESVFNYVKNRWDHCKGNADYAAYFFLNAYEKLRPNGTMGLIATNTIAQGDTREVGLDHLHKQGCAIYRANRDYPWPGLAAVVVNIIHLYKGQFVGQKWLDDRPVRFISPLLDDVAFLGNPHPLKANENLSFIGSYVLGMGFAMSPEEAQALIAANPKNADVLFPYLNGQDLNSNADQSPSRWVINFFDWPLERTAQGVWVTADDKQRTQWLRTGRVPSDYPDPVASDYPDLLAVVRETVRPQRMAQNREVRKRFWWRYAETAPKLYEAIRPLGRVLVIALTSNTLAFTFMPIGIVFSHATIVLAFDSEKTFSLLQSNIHASWIRQYGSSMKGDQRYTPSDCFTNFPFPEKMDGLDIVGKQYYQLRQQIMLENDEGLTKTYNRFHDPDEDADDIAQLRALHKKMDEAVAAAYGWSDIALEHGFHETDQGIRYTICDTARREILFRLLALNHARHAAEVAPKEKPKAQPKSAEKPPKKSGKPPAQEQLF